MGGGMKYGHVGGGMNCEHEMRYGHLGGA